MKLPLRGMLAALLAAAVLLIILIAAGVFDPKPVGKLQTTLPAQTVTVSELGQAVLWLQASLPEGEFSVRGTAVWQSGNQDSGVGVALGDFKVAVSPLGYVLVQQADEAVLPWQPWPHVQQGEQPNEIWIDVRGEAVSVWLNRELLWQGNYALKTRDLGLVGEGFGGTAVYTVTSLEIFSP